MPISLPVTVPSMATMEFPLSVCVLLFFHCAIGLVAANLAHRKGGDLGLWFCWGMVGGTLSLVTALLWQPSAGAK